MINYCIMARILYGIHGTGHGHAMRGLTLARYLKNHEFLFVAGDDAVGVLHPEFAVRKFPNLGTAFNNYKVDFKKTISRAIPLILHRQKYIDQVLRIIDEFKPDICMTDLEYFVPRAAEKANIPCLTLDHQHILTLFDHKLPVGFLWDSFVQGLTPKYLFRPTSDNLIISFYSPPIANEYLNLKIKVMPPILRNCVMQAQPSDKGHILVYQSNSIYDGFIDFLRSATKRTCYVYGYGNDKCEIDNIVLMPKSEEGFLEHLASCSYVIQGGSHTLMSEALFLGKPILTLPLKSMIEQRLNALYIERLSYGMQADMHHLSKEVIKVFESNLDSYKQTISKGHFCGNDQVFDMVDYFISNGSLPLN